MLSYFFCSLHSATNPTAIIIYTGREIRDPLNPPTILPTPCTCTKEYMPICCYGVNYQAPCFAECHGINNPIKECTIGKCQADIVISESKSNSDFYLY